MRRWTSVLVAGVFGLVVVVLVPFGASGVDDVAAQFRAPAAATEQGTVVEPERLVCLGDNPCPSLFQSWRLPRRLDRSEFESLVTAPGWEVALEGDCVPGPNSFARVGVCSATGEVDGHDVTVTQLAGRGTPTAVLTLNVRPLD